MKTLIKIILFIALLLGAIYFCWQSGILTPKESNELKIDKTVCIIEEVKKISEFTSACYYEEIVLNEKKASNLVDNKAGSLLSMITGKKKEEISSDDIAIIAKGKVRAGFDLSSISDSTLTILGDTITMVLPEVKIFDIIVNPSGFEIFEENGEWSHEEITAIETKAQDIIKQDAINYGILDKATTAGKQKLTSLFQSFGFKVVILK